jgi:hypothetical protein
MARKSQGSTPFPSVERERAERRPSRSASVGRGKPGGYVRAIDGSRLPLNRFDRRAGHIRIIEQNGHETTTRRLNRGSPS